jgi:hypothetical protein
LDTGRLHFSRVTERFTAENPIFRVLQPPDSPDLAPSDSWLFSYLKNSVAGWKFDEPEELWNGMTSLLEGIQRSELQIVFSHSLEKVRWVLENNGNHDHEKIFPGQKHLLVRFRKGWLHYLLIPLYRVFKKSEKGATWSASPYIFILSFDYSDLHF